LLVFGQSHRIIEPAISIQGRIPEIFINALSEHRDELKGLHALTLRRDGERFTVAVQRACWSSFQAVLSKQRCVKTNKSDYIDAEAIAEAVGRPKMRFVPIKSDDQLDLQSLHRVRERWVMRRTAVINQIRGLLLERGITLRKGRCHVDEALPGILEDASTKLSGALRVLLAQLKLELDHLQMRLLLATGGIFARDDSEPGCELSPLFKSCSVADRGDDCGRRNRCAGQVRELCGRGVVLH
jgi:hypothetical protein